MKAGFGVHLAGSDRIKAFRSLFVTLFELGAKLAGPFADRIGFEQGIAPIIAPFPDFKLAFHLEDANENGTVCL